MNADGSGDHPLASPGEGDARSASWSPDGSRVVYEGALIGAIGARNLYVVNADGSGVAQPLTSDGKSEHPAWRVVSQHAAGAAAPHPGAEKPKVVWITKRIFVSAARPVPMLIVGCSAPVCGVATQGTARAVGPPLTVHRPARVAAKPGKKAKQVVIGKGKLSLLEGQTKQLFMQLNKAGRELLEKQGKLDIHATVTVTSAGLPTVTSKRTLHVVLAKKKH